MLYVSTDYLITNAILELGQEMFYSLFHEFLKGLACVQQGIFGDSDILTLSERQAKDTSHSLHLYKQRHQHACKLEGSTHYMRSSLCTNSTPKII